MEISTVSARFSSPPGKIIGAIVLKVDESLEDDLRRLLTPSTRLHCSRIACSETVSSESLMSMAPLITASASLLPDTRLASVAYGCTSATSVIGAERVSALLRAGCDTSSTTDPLTAAVASCRNLGVTRLGLVTPYVV